MEQMQNDNGGLMNNIPPDRSTFNYQYLFKLRLVIARYGEMDVARWWNTKGILGTLGATALRRGLPKTHLFARTRIVFSVAKKRCEELFNPSNCFTLWNLSPSIEDQFDSYWRSWVESPSEWQLFLDNIEQLKNKKLLDIMQELNLIEPPLFEVIQNLRRSAEGRAVMLQASGEINNNLICLLAAGFSRGEIGSPTVPYSRKEG